VRGPRRRLAERAHRGARSLARGGALWLTLLCALPVPARAAADEDEALAPCAAARARGRREQAQRCYRALLEQPGPPLRMAEAYRALGERAQANDAFRAALAAEPESAQIRVRWAELFLETHQPGEAHKLFQEALERDGENLGARLGAVRALAEREGARAHALARELAQEKPGEPAVMLLLARLELEAGALARADELLAALPGDGEGGGADDECSESALELYALRAALAAMREAPPGPWRARALACNPSYGALDATVAHFLANTRRYREAVALLERAVALDPQLFAAHTELATNLLRVNRSTDARRYLEISYAGDPYRPETVNLLRLLDELDGFQTLRYAGERPGQPGLELRLAPAEAGALGPYARRLSERAIEVFGERYGFALREPVAIEMYPNHDDFAVRTSGIPGLGLLGVTFGSVVAMDSPSSRRPEEGFLWGSVLWHELAHVFTLEATEHRVPRWFSEGVSVYEEWESGPAPQRFLPESFLEALREDQLLPILALDDGFQRPKDPGQVGRSYLQAGLVCEFIAQRWTAAKLRGLLGAYGRGLGTEAALREVLELEPAAFDSAFLEFARTRAGARLGDSDWREQRGRAAAALGAGDAAAAREAAERALALEPDDVGEGSPYLLLAKAQQLAARPEEGLAALERYHARGGRDPAALAELAAALQQAGRAPAAIEVLESLRYVDPLSDALHLQLGEALLAAGRAEQAREEFEIGIALAPHDPSALRLGLARAERALGRTEQARRVLLELLEQTPSLRAAQRLLLELREPAPAPLRGEPGPPPASEPKPPSRRESEEKR
jgi:predicted Zn-dependent protease